MELLEWLFLYTMLPVKMETGIWSLYGLNWTNSLLTLRRIHVKYFLFIIACLHSWASLAPPVKVRQVCVYSFPNADTELKYISVMCPGLRVSEEGGSHSSALFSFCNTRRPLRPLVFLLLLHLLLLHWKLLFLVMALCFSMIKEICFEF